MLYCTHGNSTERKARAKGNVREVSKHGQSYGTTAPAPTFQHYSISN
jgi:hypothetical protein